MSTRIRKCGCGENNAEQENFCVRCGQPIMDLELFEIRPEIQQISLRPNVGCGGTLAKRICPSCGTINESFAILCSGSGCGTDLSNIVPVNRSEERGSTCPEIQPATEGGDRAKSGEFDPTLTTIETRARLFLVVGQQSYECHDGDILGRQGTLASNVFSEIKTVSRQHAALTKRNQSWFITVNRGVQNITQLDGRQLQCGVPEPLTGEHNLQMSSQCFVKLRVTP